MITLPAIDAKDPDDIDDFSIDWANELASGETVSTVTATVASGDATVASSSVSGTKTIARVTGGTAGTSAGIRFRMTTSAGRQLDETLVIPIAGR